VATVWRRRRTTTRRWLIPLSLALSLLGMDAATHAVGAAAPAQQARRDAEVASVTHHHPMIPAPHRQLIPQNAIAQSDNWSGYALTGPAGQFASVTGCWQVPTAASSGSNDTYSSSWIGIDGDGNGDLIQTGTQSDWYEGQGVYFAWWEILPTPETLITSITVLPGDTVCAAIEPAGWGRWTMTLSDETAAQSFATTQAYNGPRSSAEWITEAPTGLVNGSFCVLPLANYGQVTVAGGINGSPVSLSSSDGLQMVPSSQADCTGSEPNYSTPSAPNSAGDGFTVAYGTTSPTAPAAPTAPTLTSVMPSTGQNSGGQSVALTGTGFQSGAMVLFGPNASPTVSVSSSTQISAVTPSGSGTVDVTVVNPDGGIATRTSAFAYQQGVGKPVAVLTPDGGQKLVFWQGPSDNQLYEAWYGIGTHQWSGPVDLSAQLGIASNTNANLASNPTVVFTPDGGQQLVFWEGNNNDLWEAWYSYKFSNWQVQDLSSVRSLAGSGQVGSTPTVTFTPGGGQQLVFWEGTNHDLWEAWYSLQYSTWSSQDLSTGLLGGKGTNGTVVSQPSVILTPGGGQQLVFWEGANGHVWEAWYTLGPAYEQPSNWQAQDLTAVHFPTAANITSQPAVILTSGAGQQLVFYEAVSTGDLWEAWYSVAYSTWQSQDLSTAHLGGTGSVASTPVVTVTPGGGQQLVFWETSVGHLDEAWFSVKYSVWASQDLTSTQYVPITLTSPPSLVVLSNGNQDVFFQGSSQSLWELYFSGSSWTYDDWTPGS
jgi:hypothetical protein